MKKLTFYFVLAVTLLAMPVMAHAVTIEDWDLNLSSTLSYNNIDYLTVGGQSIISQDFGTDGVLTVGDTFTASSTLYTVGMVDTSTNYSQILNSIYFYSDNLAGEITSVNPDGSFVYSYTSGNISFYYESTLLATLVLDSGVGESASADISAVGDFLDGQSDFTIQFTSNPVSSGLIDFDLSLYPELGSDFLTFFVLNLNNQLFNQDPDYVTLTANGYDATVYSSGTLYLVATPEPSTFLILGLGLLGLVGFRKKFTA